MKNVKAIITRCNREKECIKLALAAWRVALVLYSIRGQAMVVTATPALVWKMSNRIM